jgi:hypothetical protein
VAFSHSLKRILRLEHTAREPLLAIFRRSIQKKGAVGQENRMTREPVLYYKTYSEILVDTLSTMYLNSRFSTLPCAGKDARFSVSPQPRGFGTACCAVGHGIGRAPLITPR